MIADFWWQYTRPEVPARRSGMTASLRGGPAAVPGRAASVPVLLDDRAFAGPAAAPIAAQHDCGGDPACRPVAPRRRACRLPRLGARSLLRDRKEPCEQAHEYHFGTMSR